MRQLGTGQALRPPARRSGGLVVVAQPPAQGPFARQGLAGEVFPQHAQEEACAPGGMMLFEVHRVAQDVRGGGGVAWAHSVIVRHGDAVTVLTAQLKQMTNRPRGQGEPLGQFGGTQALLGSSP